MTLETDDEIDAFLEKRMKEIQSLARGDSLLGLQAREKIKRIEALSVEDRRAAVRAANQAGMLDLIQPGAC